MKALLSYIPQIAKAIVAGLATFLAAKFGLDVPVDVQLALAALIVALATWLVPNKK